MPPTNDDQPKQNPINNVWATATPTSPAAVRPEFLTLPSGQTCWARRIGLEGMIEAGLLSEGDSLMSIVDEKHIKRARNAQGKNGKLREVVEEDNAVDIMRNPEMLKRIVFFVDKSIPVIVAEPMVRTHFEIVTPATVPGELPETKLVENREMGVVYTDQIGLEDKMYLFQYCVGGTRDIETFRTQSDAAVAGVDDGNEVRRPSQRSARNRGQRQGRR